MKRIAKPLNRLTTFGLLFLVFAAAPVRAQVCNGTFTLNSQAEVDAFNCTSVTGNLFIIGPDITDLSPLSTITSMGGFYLRNTMVTSLAGLENLTSVSNVLEFRDNPVLASLELLESLAGSIANTLTVNNNDALTSLDGLEGVTSVGQVLRVQFNNALSECSCGLDNLTSGNPPTFSGVGFNAVIESNAPGGACTSPEVVLVNPCTPQGPVDLVAVATSNTTVNPGGSVSFLYTVTNTTANPVTGDLFFTTRRNGATVAQGMIQSGTLPAGVRISGSYTQTVPGVAPPGAYDYTLHIGQFPNAVVDSVPFAVTVNGLAQADGPEAWTVMDATPWPEQTPEAASSAQPEAFALSAVYPNPFAASTTVGLTLPEAADVRVAVYDVLGREVGVLVDERLDAGRHTARFEASGLASGVYFVRLTAGDFTQVQRVTLMR